MKLRHIFLAILLLATLPAFGQLVLVGGCSATAATSCTPATVGGHSFASGQFIYTFAFRTAVTAPTLSSSPTFTGLDTASASSSSFRSGCAVSTSSSPSSGTWANATRVVTLIYSGSPATSTANCASNGVGGKTSAGTSGTTSTITYTGITLTHGDGSSWVIGAVGSSAATCTPVTVLHSEESATDIVGNDTNGGVTSFSTLTCTGTTGNWKSDTVELLSTTLAAPTFTPDAGGFTTVGGVYVTIGLPGGATGCYTTDNSTPTASAGSCTHGSTYSAPVLISTNGTVLQAIAAESGFVNSSVKNSTFSLKTPFSLLSLTGAGIGGFAGSLTLAPGWTFLQDTQVACTAGTNQCITPSCTSASSCLIPTTTGSVWIANVMTGNSNVSITSVTGGSGSWGSCTSLVAASCQIFNSGNDNLDAYVNTTGSAGTGAITVNLSGNAVGYFYVEFIELLPPAGYTASLHSVATGTSSSCHVCTAPSVTPGGTDAIVILTDVTQPFTNFNAWSSPYITDYESEGLCLNCASGTGPTFTQETTEGGSTGLPQTFIALDFTSTAASFTPPTPVFSLVNYYQPEDGGITTCGATCALTPPSTGSNDLLLLVEADLTSGGSHISSVSGCGTWVAPSACRTTASGNADLSCAYVLSSSSGCTSATVTMSANSSSTAFAWYEISRTSGSFVVDAGPTCTTNAANSTGFFNGVTLTIGGPIDVIFQMSIAIGGVSGASLLPSNYNAPGIGVGKFVGSAAQFYASSLMLMNSVNGAQPEYAYPEEPSNTTGVCGLSFE